MVGIINSPVQSKLNKLVRCFQLFTVQSNVASFLLSASHLCPTEQVNIFRFLFTIKVHLKSISMELLSRKVTFSSLTVTLYLVSWKSQTQGFLKKVHKKFANVHNFRSNALPVVNIIINCQFTDECSAIDSHMNIVNILSVFLHFQS